MANAALVIAETAEDCVPRVGTADWGYLRLRKVTYEASELRSWADWVLEQDWQDGFVFFKHEDEASGPELATRFQAAVSA